MIDSAIYIKGEDVAADYIEVVKRLRSSAEQENLMLAACSII